MLNTSKSAKKLNENILNNNKRTETKQNSSNRIAVDAGEPSTSNGPNVISGGGPESDEKIRMRRSNIDALRNRIMRNVMKGINNKKTEKDRLILIKLEADLVKALKNSTFNEKQFL